MVVGLGAVGQLAAQLLRIGGCRVFVSDIDPARRALAVSLGADVAIDPLAQDHLHEIRLRTEGRGVDGVLITAASSSDEIVSGALRMCRQKGRVVVVGDVGLDLRREDLYPDELELRISTSTGPGRYDPSYEVDGIDYPIGYVRWTENRNMQAVLDLIARSQLVVEPLLSEPVDLTDAVKAFASFGGDSRPVLALLRSASDAPSPAKRDFARRVAHESIRQGPLRVAVVGVGSFARAVHLPNLISKPLDFQLHAVVAQHGTTALEVKRIFHAQHATTDVDEVLTDPDVDVVLIATRHDLHADLAMRALEAGKHVLVEKPLAINAEEVHLIRSWFEAHAQPPVLMTAYNRRFSPLVGSLREWLAGRTGPAMMHYEMNAGYLPSSHWVHGPEGAGRNVGEACHVYDLFRNLLGCKPTNITASALRPPKGPYRADDNFSAIVAFNDGSICVLTYTAVGAPEHPKERLTVHVDGRTAVLDDYRVLDLGGSGPLAYRRRPAKGHREQLSAFASAIRGDESWPISLDEQLGAVEIALTVDRFLPGRSPSGD
jgi:predicted dehydrogenase